MQSALIILVSIFLLILLIFFFKKKNFLLDNKNLLHKSFASKESVPIAGGFIIFFNLILFSNNHFALYFFTLIFLLGIFSDLLIIAKPLKKFIFLQIINQKYHKSTISAQYLNHQLGLMGLRYLEVRFDHSN